MTNTQYKYCIKYLGKKNDPEGKAILQRILLFICPGVYSTEETKRDRKKGGKERERA